MILLQECLIELLQDMCGDEAVPKIFKGDKLTITLNNQKVNIDLLNLVSFPPTIVLAANGF